jgi:hypothetical protein
MDAPDLWHGKKQQEFCKTQLLLYSSTLGIMHGSLG